MTRALLIAAALLSGAVVGGVAGAQPIYEGPATTVTATIETVEQTSRVITLKTAAGSRLHVTAPPEMQGFDRLKAGDQVTARYFEAIVVRVAKPGSPAPSGAPTTITKRKDDRPGSETLSERTVRASVVSVQPTGPSLTVKMPDATEHTMKITDAAQLGSLKPGDVLDITFHESRLVSVEPAK